jgi:DNA invertase Pin-like site-specific DNA recombinase
VTSEATERIVALHREGKGPVEIARIVGLGRHQVSRVIADAQATEDEGSKPIRCQRRPTAKETFPTQAGDTA